MTSVYRLNIFFISHAKLQNYNEEKNMNRNNCKILSSIAIVTKILATLVFQIAGSFNLKTVLASFKFSSRRPEIVKTLLNELVVWIKKTRLTNADIKKLERVSFKKNCSICIAPCVDQHRRANFINLNMLDFN